MVDFTPISAFHDTRADEILDTYREDAKEGGLSLFATVYDDVLLVMGSDSDGTVFFPPEELAAEADRNAALSALEEYAGAGCTPLLFVGLSADDVDLFSLRYPKHEVFEMDEGLFGFSVLTPLNALDALPECSDNGISLSAPTPDDEAFYEKLKKDSQGSLYGFGLAPGKSLFDEITTEWAERMAAAFVIRKDGTPVGEVTLFSFDGHGGARIAIRICRDYRNKGIAKAALGELFALAWNDLHLTRLYADVDEQNAPSLSLFSRLMVESHHAEGAVHFYRNL